MTQKYHIPMYDLVVCMSSAIDLISTALSDHNRRVAAIAAHIMEELVSSENQVIDVIIAGSLHDIGALSLKERLNLLSFEVNDVQKHAELGYRHIKSFSPLADIAPLIRYHHYSAKQLDNCGLNSEKAFQCGVLHLADRISVLINNDVDILSQKKFITDIIKPAAGTLFYKEAVDAFLSVSEKESFWLTVTGRHINKYLETGMSSWKMFLDLDQLYEFAKLFGRVIDFRSSFTAVHSSRVSRIASAIAEYMGMTPSECRLIGIAGLLHDLGKLAVPSEILEKPSDLTPSEWNIMRSHSFYTYELLSGIKGFETINRWASSHHERLDGTGYPFRYTKNSISKGERIIAVADIFTALTEDRPYRTGLSPDESLSILNKLVGNGAIDSEIVKKVSANIDSLNRIRIEAENEIAVEYNEFIYGI